MSAQRTVCSPPQSQSLTVAWSSPPTYWIGFCTLGSSGSKRSNAEPTGICPDYGRRSNVSLMSDLPEKFERAEGRFQSLVHQVTDDKWAAPTPCSDWDVRALVNHLVYEARWAPPLLEGKTIAEVGDRFDGDLLGDDPRAAYDDAVEAACRAIEAPGALDGTV